MSPSSNDPMTPDRRYALCVGIGTYTHLRNRNLRFAVDDARAIARCLEGSLPDSFEVKLLTEPIQTSKAALHEAVENLLSAPDRQAEDLVVIFFSCHGDLSTPENTFYLLPSDAALQSDGNFDPTTIISISDLAGWFSQAKTHNIVMLLDVCHSGGAGVVVQHFKLNLSAGPNFFIIGGARQDQVTRQSSQLEHGLFTHCLLRAFEQPPIKEGWLTISQIHTFVSEEISWFAREYPIQIQGVSISVNPNLPLVRNPSYPELCPLPPIWNISEGRNPFFTGQEEVLARLTSTLHKEQKTALSHPQAIAGLGGIGKTQVALEYAYRHRQDYHAILWSLADTREALITTFVNIATLLDLPEKNEQNQMVTVEAVKRWLAGRSKWLLVLDNADDISIVKEFIPSAFQGHLLVTTPHSCLGYVRCGLEIASQIADQGLHLDAIYVPFGTGGIFTGLLLALREKGITCPIIGISVNRKLVQCYLSLKRWWAELCRLLERDPHRSRMPFEIYDDFIGRECGDPTEACLDAIGLMAQTEGILLDPVYSGKVMSGFLAHHAIGRWEAGSQILLLHSGGTPALFAYSAEIKAHLSKRGVSTGSG